VQTRNPQTIGSAPLQLPASQPNGLQGAGSAPSFLNAQQSNGLHVVGATSVKGATTQARVQSTTARPISHATPVAFYLVVAVVVVLFVAGLLYGLFHERSYSRY
jgi:hypothetical protein